jgi:hypothetical protein
MYLLLFYKFNITGYNFLGTLISNISGAITLIHKEVTLLAPSDLFKKLTEKEVKPHELYNACFARPLSDNSTLELKTTHAYYYQIQFQLAITEILLKMALSTIEPTNKYNVFIIVLQV